MLALSSPCYTRKPIPPKRMFVQFHHSIQQAVARVAKSLILFERDAESLGIDSVLQNSESYEE